MTAEATPRRLVAFVAGATGYTGQEVVRALIEANGTAIAHVRPDSPRLQEWRERFEAMGALPDATPWEERALVDRLTAARPTHVFALLGTTRARAAAAARTGGPAADYETVDYGLTVRLLRAAAACGWHPRFVYLSSIGASERTRNPYMRARGRVEAEIRASALPALIVRPSFISGPDRDESRPVERAAAFAFDRATRALALLGARGLRARYRPRTARELARSMVRLAIEERDGVVEAEEL